MDSQAIQTIKERIYTELNIEIASRHQLKDGALSKPGQKLSRYFDHTLLKNNIERAMILQLCREAIEWDMMSVCVPPNKVELAHSVLKGSDVRVCTVVSFPYGYDSSIDKQRQTERVVGEGAEEIDMVLSISDMKDKNYRAVFDDIRKVRDAAGGQLLKVILETCLLTVEELVLASLLTQAAGADMLKTSTGVSTAGAQVDDIALMRQVAGDNIGIKASGGIRSRAFALECVRAGADRIGASASVAILNEEETKTGT